MNINVAFLAYNRPERAARVFQEIARAQPARLLFVADGPKDDADAERCSRTRALVDRVDWPCEVLTNFADVNMGCRRRVSTGLDWVFGQVEEAVILEDDCLPHASFFPYCAEMLEHYRDDGRVGHIAGVNLLDGYRRSTSSYYFSRYNYVWGWASWRRAWQYYDVDVTLWPELREQGWHFDVYPDRRQARWFRERMDGVYSGAVDTWDYQWLFARLVNGLHSAVPNTNMVVNIGFGIGASNCQVPPDHPLARMTMQEMTFPLDHPPVMITDSVTDARFADKWIPCAPSAIRTWLAKLSNRYFYGRIIRRIPLLGRLWARHRDGRAAPPRGGS